MNFLKKSLIFTVAVCALWACKVRFDESEVSAFNRSTHGSCESEDLAGAKRFLSSARGSLQKFKANLAVIDMEFCVNEINLQNWCSSRSEQLKRSKLAMEGYDNTFDTVKSIGRGIYFDEVFKTRINCR